MNKARRKEIGEIYARLEAAIPKFEEIKEDLQSIHDEELDAYEALPEGLQQSEAGQASYDATGSLYRAVDDVDTVANLLQSVLDSLDEAST